MCRLLQRDVHVPSQQIAIAFGPHAAHMEPQGFAGWVHAQGAEADDTFSRPSHLDLMNRPQGLITLCQTAKLCHSYVFASITRAD